MKFLLWNVQGIRKSGIMKVENQLLHSKPDVAILTETNLLPNQINPFSLLSKNHTCLLSCNEQRGTGVAVILSSNCRIISQPVTDPKGRFIAVSILYQEFLKLNILAIYAPAKTSLRNDWYNELFSLILPFDSIDIFAGDFNLITSPEGSVSQCNYFSPLVNKFNDFLEKMH
jgi:exonuclease III